MDGFPESQGDTLHPEGEGRTKVCTSTERECWTRKENERRQKGHSQPSGAKTLSVPLDVTHIRR